jgi:predicted DCC family thiol-disulfide oxidoreductase YuxK
MIEEATKPAEIEVFFDGGCPSCLREIDFLKGRDRHGRIKFTDIDAPDFSTESCGKTYDELMAKIYGRLPDGTWITGVEVFRRLYSAFGFTTVLAVTRLPVISQVMNLGYRLFAKNRLRLTGRCAGQTCSVKRYRANQPT